ncbi:MAG: acyl-CoA dehydrogenase family protein [Actinomycetota bacterium]|nr:acyl-CoA dehydrogenase family protein [Actinomycetota bacterium]
MDDDLQASPVPPFTRAHERLRGEMRTFVTERLRPWADDWEQAGWCPNDVFGWLADAGYLGLRFDPACGGAGDTAAAAVFPEELARCGSGGLAAGLGAHTAIALPPIERFGTEEQKQRRLVPGLRGELVAALAITEPGAGSDVASLRTHAKRVDGGWVANGSKTFITGGVRADVLVCGTHETRRRTSRHLLPADREGCRRDHESAAQARLACLGHRRDRLGRRVCPRGGPAGRRARRLLPDHGQLPVGAAVDGARRDRRHAGLL